MKMTLLFKMKHGALTVKERRVIATVWNGVNESDSSDTELPSSPAKRRCNTRSGRSATPRQATPTQEHLGLFVACFGIRVLNY